MVNETPPSRTPSFLAVNPEDSSLRQEKPLRLAMLGMIPGNGHPYSWSAIVNGYDPVEMSHCPYSMIPEYLAARPLESVGIPGTPEELLARGYAVVNLASDVGLLAQSLQTTLRAFQGAPAPAPASTLYTPSSKL